jgi:hypothetical protein
LQASVFLSPTAPAMPLPDPYGRKQLLLDDPLVTNTSGRWQVGTSSNKSSCSFRMGGYDVQATHYHYTCKDMIDTFANFVLQVDLSLSRQSEGRVLFRAAQTGGGYYFGIDDQGNYEIGKNNPAPPLKHVLHPDTPKNTYELTIVANGSSVTMYIDGKPLDHFDDTSYSDGYIALAVDGVAQPNTEVIFTNLKVWQR